MALAYLQIFTSPCPEWSPLASLPNPLIPVLPSSLNSLLRDPSLPLIQLFFVFLVIAYFFSVYLMSLWGLDLSHMCLSMPKGYWADHTRGIQLLVVALQLILWLRYISGTRNCNWLARYILSHLFCHSKAFPKESELAVYFSILIH